MGCRYFCGAGHPCGIENKLDGLSVRFTDTNSGRAFRFADEIIWPV